MSLKKAMIVVERGKKQEKIDVLFNPSEYSLDSQNTYSWQEIPGLAPIGQFVSSDSSTLTMELFFDTYEEGKDVRSHTKKIASLLDIDKDLHAPPSIKFVWGSLNFKGVVEKVNQRFTMFLDSGIPVRATLNVTFREVSSIVEQQRENSLQSADRTKQRTLKQGDELWMIASDEYEDPGNWRQIAKANHIDNPKRLKPGTRLIVPRLQ
ncbi:CIS tube protein [Paenibacillus koleovorans]|uniref:CIS tube protein n=1 Tax=Paenibacillus koleovorans TaxID=121608 RepID=UPI000FD9CF90|nr:LysM peptidoglycan-binding domain-containing protein [Paenibacillus koleovorans]